MRAITYNEACNNFVAELDRVNNDYDVTIITRQKSDAWALMPLQEYESLLEICSVIHFLELENQNH